jgi:hypothetical protein
MATVNSVCDRRFKPLQDVLEANLASGDELGASIVVDLDGETVVDLDRRLTFAYMMNKMAPGIIGSDRAEAYVRTVYGVLDVGFPPAEE